MGNVSKCESIPQFVALGKTFCWSNWDSPPFWERIHFLFLLAKHRNIMKYPNLKGFFRGFSGTALSSNSFTPLVLLKRCSRLVLVKWFCHVFEDGVMETLCLLWICILIPTYIRITMYIYLCTIYNIHVYVFICSLVVRTLVAWSSYTFMSRNTSSRHSTYNLYLPLFG